MRVTLAAVGRMKDSPEKVLLEKYIRQLPWTFVIKEIEIKKTLDTNQRKDAEAQKLLEACNGAHKLIALDERGENKSSESLATHIADWQQQGCSHLGIIIGGQDGLSQSVHDSSHLLLSFGKLTWPHMLVRTMLAEQLYRVHTILSGHPYNRS